MATSKKKQIDPSGVVKGSHLTVTTLSDGTTKLEWDDEALLNDVRAAILGVQASEPVVTKAKRVQKNKES
jgi:hypothetical protein